MGFFGGKRECKADRLEEIMDYKKAGVDIEAGYKSVELMKEHVAKTMRPEVLGGLGGFSGAFSLAKIKEMGRRLYYNRASANGRLRDQGKAGDHYGQARYHRH